MAITVTGPRSSREFDPNQAKLNTQISRDSRYTKKFTADPFWDVAEIEEERWSESYPFQLRILRAVTGGYVTDSEGIQLPVFTLPIPPSAISKSSPFAINVEATQGGILEEHNGIKFTDISMSGSFGILPGRSTGTILQENFSQNIFAGTINAAQRTENRLNAFATGKETPESSVVSESELKNELRGTTGYYQMLVLGEFLEAYGYAKTKQKGKDLRLAFCHYKTKSCYLVTPLVFNVIQDVTSPLEFKYSLSFKAWKRIQIDDVFAFGNDVDAQLSQQNSLNFTKILDRLENLRLAIQGVQSTLRASGADVSAIVNRPARLLSGTLKDLLGIPKSAADIPLEMVRELKGSVMDAISVNSKFRDTVQGITASSRKFAGDFSQIVQESINAGLIIQPTKNFKAGGVGNTGVSKNRSGLSDGTSVINQLLDDQDSFYDFFGAISLTDLNLPQSVRQRLAVVKRESQQLRQSNWKADRDRLLVFINDYEKRLGLVPETYGRVYGIQSAVSVATPTETEFEALVVLNDLLTVLDRMSIIGPLGDEGQEEAISFIGEAARASGNPFTFPSAQFLIPFPYGSSPEKLALRYLGSAERWLEIAALNNLRSPYVDEEGFSVPFIANGNGNTIWLSSAQDLIVGKKIYLSSTVVNREIRTILNIEIFNDAVKLVLDGASDLSKFTIQAGATLQSFLPGTVNSQSLIAIPTLFSPTVSEQGPEPVLGIDNTDPMTRIGGVDLGLTEDMDAAITTDGDWRLAIGIQAVIQRMKVFFQTPVGTDIRNPQYGLTLKVGDSTADSTAQSILQALTNYTRFEPAISKALAASVEKNGNYAKLDASFELISVNTLLPVSFNVALK